jgi:hypothetical protein
MGMYARYIAINNIEKFLQQDEGTKYDLLLEWEYDSNLIEDNYVYSLGKMWHILHYVFTKESWNSVFKVFPLSYAIFVRIVLLRNNYHIILLKILKK